MACSSGSWTGKDFELTASSEEQVITLGVISNNWEAVIHPLVKHPYLSPDIVTAKQQGLGQQDSWPGYQVVDSAWKRRSDLSGRASVSPVTNSTEWKNKCPTSQRGRTNQSWREGLPCKR